MELLGQLVECFTTAMFVIAGMLVMSYFKVFPLITIQITERTEEEDKEGEVTDGKDKD